MLVFCLKLFPGVQELLMTRPGACRGLEERREQGGFRGLSPSRAAAQEGSELRQPAGNSSQRRSCNGAEGRIGLRALSKIPSAAATALAPPGSFFEGRAELWPATGTARLGWAARGPLQILAPTWAGSPADPWSSPLPSQGHLEQVTRAIPALMA